jgi:hypothetical protein
MHQKQPPAKIAVLVAAGEESCARLRATVTAASVAQPSARRKLRFIVSILDTILIGAL